MVQCRLVGEQAGTCADQQRGAGLWDQVWAECSTQKSSLIESQMSPWAGGLLWPGPL